MKTLSIVLCLLSAVSAGVDVLLVGIGPWSDWDDAVAALDADPRIASVTFFDAWQGTPPVSYLVDYGVVIVDWSGSHTAHRPVMLGDHLADAVDQGTPVILGTMAILQPWDALRGDIVVAPYCPLPPATTNAWDWSRNTWDSGHPILADVAAPPTDCQYILVADQATAGSTVQSRYAAQGGVAPIQVATNADKTVVAINYAMCDSYARWWAGDGWLMLANACAWLASDATVYSAIQATTWGQIKAGL